MRWSTLAIFALTTLARAAPETVISTVIIYTATSTLTETVTGAPSANASPCFNPLNTTSTTYPRSKLPIQQMSSSSTNDQPTPLPKSSWPDHKVIGYYATNDEHFMEPSNIPWNLLTHIYLGFGTIDSNYTINIDQLALMSNLFSTAVSNGVKPGLSVGGWGYGSSRYSSMVASSKFRSSFIESLKTLVDQYGITGIDIDWEYPGEESAMNVPYDAKNDMPNYLLLLQELRNEFGNNLTISAALGVAPYADDVSEMATYFDWTGLMYYDFGQYIASETASNSPLNGSDSAVVSVKLWSSAGLPKEKMIFGLPSYGRNFTMVDPNSPSTDGMINLIDQSKGYGSRRWRDMISEGVLVADPAVGEGVYIAGTGWQQNFDWTSVTPYLWNNVTGEFVTYDDPVSISYKREYAVQQGMQGMLVFDVEIDTLNGELMQYMN